MNLKSLLYIITIAEEKNLSRAAKRLYVSQSTLSLFLKKLEEELGFALFIRSNRQLQITPFGEEYVKTARQILQIKDDLYNSVCSPVQHPEMNIGISSQMIRTIFASLLEEGIPTGLTVNLQEGRTPAMMAKLRDHTLDSVIIGWDSIPDIEACSTRLLKKERIAIMLSPSHPCAHLASSDYNDPPILHDMSKLADEKWVLTPRDTIDHVLAARMHADYSLHPHIAYEINDTASITRMVMTGSYVAAIPEYCIPRNQDVLVCRPPKDYYRYLVFIQSNEHQPSMSEISLINQTIERYLDFY